MPEFAPSFAIKGRPVGAGARCFVIAEAGVAHFGDPAKARALADLARSAGADVVKFQHFHTERLFGPSAQEWRERMRDRQLSDDEMAALARYCEGSGIPFICTAHDEESLEFLDRVVGVPAFKIGSGEVENWPFLRDVARRGKPVILSTGLYTLDLIRQAVQVIADAGCRELAILHCVTAYPAEPHTINLDAMRQIREFFDGPVGYSDHTAGTVIPLAAVALGGAIIEKHISLDFNVPNAQDWKVSCGPHDFAQFVSDVRKVEAARGGGTKQLAPAELNSRTWARKSITASCDIPAGTTITPPMLILQRPGDGLPGTELNAVVGSVTRHAIARGTKLNMAMLVRPSVQAAR